MSNTGDNESEEDLLIYRYEMNSVSLDLYKRFKGAIKYKLGSDTVFLDLCKRHVLSLKETSCFRSPAHNWCL